MVRNLRKTRRFVERGFKQATTSRVGSEMDFSLKLQLQLQFTQIEGEKFTLASFESFESFWELFAFSNLIWIQGLTAVRIANRF